MLAKTIPFLPRNKMLAGGACHTIVKGRILAHAPSLKLTTRKEVLKVLNLSTSVVRTTLVI